MGLFSKASLIVTPNAYKESKLYSVVPNTTLGDMDVVRATTATRVNSAGLIEVVPRNLLQFSEQIDNAIWTKSGVTITANAVNSPIGTLTADLVTPTISDASLRQSFLAAGAMQYNFSVYLRSATGSSFSTSIRCWRDSPFQNITNSVITVTTEWQRFNFSFTALDSSTHIIAIGASSTLSTGENLYVWGAQLDLGAATEYFPTTTRLNIPRIDYTNGSCPSLLVEPQRTNYSLNSNNLSQWINQTTNTTITRIQSGGIAGEFDRLTTTGTGAKGRFVQVSALIGTNAVFSIYLKGTGQVSIGIANAGQTTNIPLTLTTQWQRFETKITTGIAGYMDFSIYVFGGSTVDVSSSQLEFATYATSYIPTVASTVTRNADVISKTGISSLIGQTEGTIFLEADIQKRNASDFYIGISNGYSLGEAIYLNQPSSGNLNVLFRTGVLTPTISILSANWNAGNNKIAIAYNSTLGEVFINGVSKGTVALTGIPTCNQIALASRTDSPGGLIGAGPYKQAIVFKTRLSNTELAQLTTL